MTKKETKAKLLNVQQHNATLNQSIVWWSKEMEKAILEADRLDNAEWYAEKDADVDKVTKQLEYLVSKGQVELKNLDKHEIEVAEAIKLRKKPQEPK